MTNETPSLKERIEKMVSSHKCGQCIKQGLVLAALEDVAGELRKCVEEHPFKCPQCGTVKYAMMVDDVLRLLVGKAGLHRSMETHGNRAGLHASTSPKTEGGEKEQVKP
jgi:hypothetical protein